MTLKCCQRYVDNYRYLFYLAPEDQTYLFRYAVRKSHFFWIWLKFCNYNENEINWYSHVVCICSRKLVINGGWDIRISLYPINKFWSLCCVVAFWCVLHWWNNVKHCCYCNVLIYCVFKPDQIQKDAAIIPSHRIYLWHRLVAVSSIVSCFRWCSKHLNWYLLRNVSACIMTSSCYVIVYLFVIVERHHSYSYESYVKVEWLDRGPSATSVIVYGLMCNYFPNSM